MLEVPRPLLPLQKPVASKKILIFSSLFVRPVLVRLEALRAEAVVSTIKTVIQIKNSENGREQGRQLTPLEEEEVAGKRLRNAGDNALPIPEVRAARPGSNRQPLARRVRAG